MRKNSLTGHTEGRGWGHRGTTGNHHPRFKESKAYKICKCKPKGFILDVKS